MATTLDAAATAAVPRSPTARALVAHACGWVVVCLALVALARLVPQALFFGGTPPVPLRANPTLLTLGIVLTPLGLLLFYLADRYSRVSKPVLGIGAVTTVILCVGAMLAALYPGSGSLLARDLVAQPEAQVQPSVFALPVFFRNGETRLLPDEARRLEDAFAVFRDCEAGTLRVRGFASSRAFAVNSDALNLQLANERARAVKVALDKLLGGRTTLFQWDSFERMAAARRLHDLAPDGSLIGRMERYNRRAEIFWSDSACLGLGTQTPAPPATVAPGSLPGQPIVNP